MIYKEGVQPTVKHSGYTSVQFFCFSLSFLVSAASSHQNSFAGALWLWLSLLLKPSTVAVLSHRPGLTSVAGAFAAPSRTRASCEMHFLHWRALSKDIPIAWVAHLRSLRAQQSSSGSPCEVLPCLLTSATSFQQVCVKLRPRNALLKWGINN